MFVLAREGGLLLASLSPFSLASPRVASSHGTGARTVHEYRSHRDAVQLALIFVRLDKERQCFRPYRKPPLLQPSAYPSLPIDIGR